MYFVLVVCACLLSLAFAWRVRSTAAGSRRNSLAAGQSGERRVGSLLDEAGGTDRLDGFVVGDSPRHSAEIDHLVRGTGVLVVVEAKNWRGVISGGKTDEHWLLARDGRQPERRRNPLNQADRQARLVAKATGLPRRAVRSLVVMAGRARHESGCHPQGMIAAREIAAVLPETLKGDAGDVERVDEAWTRLVDMAYAPGAEHRSRVHSDRLDKRWGAKPWQAWMVVSFALAALAFTMSLCVLALQMQSMGQM